MPRYYCDYCDTYLTHDSPSVRKQHNAGYKHKANVRSYYQQFEQQQTQSLIDQKIKEHLGQAAVYQQVGAAYSQLLAQRPRLPVLPPPVMPIPGTAQVPGAPPLLPGMRPPPAMLPIPRPMTSAPAGYASGAPMPPVMVPPGAPSVPGQMNGLPRPPTSIPETSAASSTPVPSNGAPSQAPNVTYQSNPAAPPPGSFDSYGVNVSTPEAAQ